VISSKADKWGDNPDDHQRIFKKERLSIMYRNDSLILFIAAVVFLFCLSCGEEEGGPLVIADEYDGSMFETNAVHELAVLRQLENLRAEAAKGRIAGQSVSATALQTLYESGPLSLKNIVTDYYANLLEGESGYFSQLALASGNQFTPGETEGEGGVYQSYLFDENGLELEQAIVDGMIGAALYHHAVTLFEGTLTSGTPDHVLAIFGGSPGFPNSGDGTKHPIPDRLAAAYAASRDKNVGLGFYDRIEKHFITLQAAIAKGEEYAEYQQSAIQGILENWEKATAGTVIHYLSAGQSKLSQANATDASRAGALHDISKGIGLLSGWKGIPETEKILKEEELDGLLLMLKAPVGMTPSPYEFIMDPENELHALQEVIEGLKAIYAFTDQELSDFENDWVSVQGR
jgi:hypothetical protein